MPPNASSSFWNHCAAKAKKAVWDLEEQAQRCHFKADATWPWDDSNFRSMVSLRLMWSHRSLELGNYRWNWLGRKQYPWRNLLRHVHKLIFGVLNAYSKFSSKAHLRCVKYVCLWWDCFPNNSLVRGAFARGHHDVRVTIQFVYFISRSWSTLSQLKKSPRNLVVYAEWSAIICNELHIHQVEVGKMLPTSSNKLWDLFWISVRRPHFPLQPLLCAERRHRGTWICVSSYESCPKAF